MCDDCPPDNQNSNCSSQGAVCSRSGAPRKQFIALSLRLRRTCTGSSRLLRFLHTAAAAAHCARLLADAAAAAADDDDATPRPPPSPERFIASPDSRSSSEAMASRKSKFYDDDDFDDGYDDEDFYADDYEEPAPAPMPPKARRNLGLSSEAWLHSFNRCIANCNRQAMPDGRRRCPLTTVWPCRSPAPPPAPRPPHHAGFQGRPQACSIHGCSSSRCFCVCTCPGGSATDAPQWKAAEGW